MANVSNSPRNPMNDDPAALDAALDAAMVAAAATPGPDAAADLQRVTLVRGEHRWHFRWDAAGAAALIEHIADLARRADVPFDWFDAAIICRQIATPTSGAHLGATAAPRTPNATSNKRAAQN